MASIWDRPSASFRGSTTQQSPMDPTAFTKSLGNMFFDGSSSYGAKGGKPGGLYTSPLSATLREQNPDASFAFYGQNLGIPDNESGFSKWFYNQLPRFTRAYSQATIVNPMITIDDFMQTLPSLQQLLSEYGQMSPVARGENEARFAPQVRWLSR